MRRFPLLFSALVVATMVTSCSTTKPIQQSAQTIATEAEPETIVDTSAPPADTIAPTITEPPTTNPAPDSEAALRQRVLAAHDAYVQDTLSMPNTDFATSKSFFVSEEQAAFSYRIAISRAAKGGTTRRNTPDVSEYSIVSIEVTGNESAVVHICNVNNRITLNPGPDGVLDTSDDELVSDDLATTTQTDKWLLINGVWKFAENVAAKRILGRVPCES
jgi:hypothetical protein